MCREKSLEKILTWDPAKMREVIIDLSVAGAQRAIMLEMQGNVPPSHKPIATLETNNKLKKFLLLITFYVYIF
jgi:hypothetical protein